MDIVGVVSHFSSHSELKFVKIEKQQMRQKEINCDRLISLNVSLHWIKKTVALFAMRRTKYKKELNRLN